MNSKHFKDPSRMDAFAAVVVWCVLGTLLLDAIKHDAPAWGIVALTVAITTWTLFCGTVLYQVLRTRD